MLYPLNHSHRGGWFDTSKIAVQLKQSGEGVSCCLCTSSRTLQFQLANDRDLEKNNKKKERGVHF